MDDDTITVCWSCGSHLPAVPDRTETRVTATDAGPVRELIGKHYCVCGVVNRINYGEVPDG